MEAGREAEGGMCGGDGGNGRKKSYKPGTMEEEKSVKGLNECSARIKELSKSV